MVSNSKSPTIQGHCGIRHELDRDHFGAHEFTAESKVLLRRNSRWTSNGSNKDCSELEAELSARTEREKQLGREQTRDSARDIGDSGVADEAASEDFAEAELNSTVGEKLRVNAQLVRVRDDYPLWQVR